MTLRSRLLLPAAIAALLTIASAISFARAAEVQAGALTIRDVWARATPPGSTVGAAYLTVENRGAAGDRLLRAESPLAQSVQLHRTVEENGMATMRPLQHAAIPPGGALAMQPGGAHMMLMGLSAALKAGATLPLTLFFEEAGPVTVEATIVPIGTDPQAQSHHQHPM